MQVIKIDSTNFKGKLPNSTKNITKELINKNIPEKMLGLAGLATANLANIELKKEKGKSYEKEKYSFIKRKNNL